jgi:hypothetical protein
MGIVGHGIFQARRDGRWVDLASDVDPCDDPANDWLESRQPHRGLPPDLDVFDNGWHPTADPALQVLGKRGWPAGKSPPSTYVICLDGHVQSWLHADEILAGAVAEIAEWQAILDERRKYDADAGADMLTIVPTSSRRWRA